MQRWLYKDQTINVSIVTKYQEYLLPLTTKNSDYMYVNKIKNERKKIFTKKT